LGAARITKIKLSGQPICSIIRITLWNGYGATFATELSRSLGDTVVLTIGIWIGQYIWFEGEGAEWARLAGWALSQPSPQA